MYCWNSTTFLCIKLVKKNEEIPEQFAGKTGKVTDFNFLCLIWLASLIVCWGNTMTSFPWRFRFMTLITLCVHGCGCTWLSPPVFHNSLITWQINFLDRSSPSAFLISCQTPGYNPPLFLFCLFLCPSGVFNTCSSKSAPSVGALNLFFSFFSTSLFLC